MGFTEIRVTERTAFGLDDLATYPLFAPDFIDSLRQLIPPQRHGELVFSIVVTAIKSESGPHA